MYKADGYFTPSKGLNIRDGNGQIVEVIKGNSAQDIALKAAERLRELNAGDEPSTINPDVTLLASHTCTPVSLFTI
jgi:hypothetical protein